MTHTHDLSEWAAFLLLGVGVHGAFSVPYFLLVDSDSARDFDPRPAVSRAIESGRLDAVLVVVANAKYDVREFAADARQLAVLSLRDAAFTAAALLALLLPAPEGATR